MGAGHDAAQVFQAVGAVGQRAARLETHVALPQVRIVAGDIGRVGHDQVEALACRQRAVPATLDETHRGGQLPRIARGHRQRRGADIAGHHAGIAPCQGDRDGDGAAAGAQVQHRGRGLSGHGLQRGFHQHLGVRTRNQHIGRHAEQVPHEFSLPEQIGHRLAGQAALRQRFVGRGHFRRQRIGVVRQQPRARLGQHVLEQHAHLEPGQARVQQQAPDLGGHAQAPIRCRRPAPPTARPGARRSGRRSVPPDRPP